MLFLVQICCARIISSLCMSVCTQVVYCLQIERFLLFFFPWEVQIGASAAIYWQFVLSGNNPTLKSLCRWSGPGARRRQLLCGVCLGGCLTPVLFKFFSIISQFFRPPSTVWWVAFNSANWPFVSHAPQLLLLRSSSFPLCHGTNAVYSYNGGRFTTKKS